MFPPLPTHRKYSVVYADPPWMYGERPERLLQGSAERHYPTVHLDELRKLPVSSVCTEDCALLMWTNGPHLINAVRLMEAWGFQYKQVFFCWIKTTKDGKPKTGLGHYTRGSCELCLLGVRGRVASRLRQDRSVGQTIHSVPGKHSEKPAEAVRRINRFFGPDVFKIELFSRNEPYDKSWDVWGNEALTRDSGPGAR